VDRIRDIMESLGAALAELWLQILRASSCILSISFSQRIQL
jgi:hypothetical protein